MTVQNLNPYDHMYNPETTVGVGTSTLDLESHYIFGAATYSFADDFILQLKERLGTITVQEKDFKELKNQYIQNLEDLREYKKEVYDKMHAQIFNNHVCQACKKEVL